MSTRNKSAFFTSELFLNIIFYVFVSLLILVKVLLFFNLNITQIDSDQPFMWMGAKDFSQGHFYEPRFYGQDYNTFMEALFAVPFIWMNLPVYYAVPIATHIIFLFPVLFTAFYLFFKGKKANAIAVLAIILCLPLGYDILTGIPRGFVTGMFFTAFFVMSFLDPQNMKWIVLNMFCATLGFFVNPNSVLVSAPLMIFLFLHNYQNKKFYYAAGGALLFMLFLHWFFDSFYTQHPSYVIMGINYQMSHTYFLENIAGLDFAFGHVSFFFDRMSIVLLIVLFVLLIVLWKYNREAVSAYTCFLIIILISLFSGKTREGAPWPFYSFSRMYLGIPVVIYLFSSLLEIKEKFLLPGLIAITLLFSTYKFINFENTLAYHLDNKHWLGVRLTQMKHVMDGVRVYREECKKHQVNYLVVSNVFWLNTYLVNGGPAIYDDFPVTQDTQAERRYWIREGHKDSVVTKFMFISGKSDVDSLLINKKFDVEVLDGFGMFLIKNNKTTMGEFMKLAKNS
jgi:hypothetical protein